MHQCLEIQIHPIDNRLKNLGKNVHISRPLTSGRSPSQTNTKAKNATDFFFLLKNVLFTIRALNFSLFFGTLWRLPGSVSGLESPSPLNKILPFSILTKPPDSSMFGHLVDTARLEHSKPHRTAAWPLFSRAASPFPGCLLGSIPTSLLLMVPTKLMTLSIPH